jgi:hypothetical protein
MARGRASPLPSSLPIAEFTKVQDDYSSQPAGVADLQARSYGCMYNGGCCVLEPVIAHRVLFTIDNDGSTFKRPEHYIRYIGASI